MLAKDLIKVLQACDPESSVEVTFERADIYRMDMIKRCIKIGSPEALTQMEIDGVLLEEDKKNSRKIEHFAIERLYAKSPGVACHETAFCTPSTVTTL